MDRFLAIHAIPKGITQEAFKESLLHVAKAADQLGLHVTETLYNLERAQAFSVFEADSADDVRKAAELAGIPQPDVFRADILYTELLAEPRRAR
jgi:hypothetical protein